VFSEITGQEWLRGWKGSMKKVEGIQEVEGTAKLSSLTSSHLNGYNFSYKGPNDAVPVALKS